MIPSLKLLSRTTCHLLPTSRARSLLSFEDFKKMIPREMALSEINHKILPAASPECLDAAQESWYKHHYERFTKNKCSAEISFHLTEGKVKGPN